MEMACRFQVNPLLVSLGVVYDHNLVAEPVQKTFSTASAFPIECPYIPAKCDWFERRNLVYTGGELEPLAPGEKHGSTSQDFSNGCSTLGGTLPMENVCNTSSNGNVGNTLGVSVGIGNTLSSLAPTANLYNAPTRQRLDMWHPDTNGTMYRNGSVTLAINGFNIDSLSWADPKCIPLWAFQKNEDFIRANPFSPGLGFVNDQVLIPAPSSSSVQLVDMDHAYPLRGETKKRKTKKPVTTEADLSKQKKPKNMYSPCLRLSNTRGRGRGGAARGRGRGRKLVKKDTSSSDTHFVELNENILDFGAPVTTRDLVGASNIIGTEDSTHLRGCGGWPKSAARSQ